MVYNWQFVSFMRSNGTTLDLIIRKECDLLSLINVVQQTIYLPEMQQRLMIYKTMRVKMIIAYEAWNRHLKPFSLFE